MHVLHSTDGVLVFSPQYFILKIFKYIEKLKE